MVLVVFLLSSEVVMSDEKIEQLKLADDGTFPNSNLPLLVYKGFFTKEKVSASAFEKVFTENKWHGFWRNGVYNFHHYHSTAHEVLGVYAGKAKVQFGGKKGKVLDVSSGDVVVIPAGVSHKLIEADKAFAVVGGYPPGQMWDMNYGRAGERPKADRIIAKVAIPKFDPLYGEKKGLCKIWNKKDQRRTD